MLTLEATNKQLTTVLQSMKRVIVAFSGGVDSTLVLHKAIEVLGSDNVIGVIVKSELFRHEEFTQATELAQQLGAHVIETEIEELQDANIVNNTPQSWYYSKRLLYAQLDDLKHKYHCAYVLDGMIMDDLDDYRPGLQARDDFSVRSVLQEVELYKYEVRTLSKQADLPVWNKPALCSLASRIPYGETLTMDKITKVNEAEKIILNLNINHVRVRYHNNIARIEVADADIATLVQHRQAISLQLKELGFDYVTIDMDGYRVGSMNEVLNSSASH